MEITKKMYDQATICPHKRAEPQNLCLLNQIMQVSVGCWIGHGPTYSVALAKGIPMKVGLSVSVYISIPVPRR